MRTDALRWWLVGVLAAAAVVSVVANKADSPFLGWVSFALFLAGVAIYVRWRRAGRAVGDPEDDERAG